MNGSEQYDCKPSFPAKLNNFAEENQSPVLISQPVSILPHIFVIHPGTSFSIHYLNFFLHNGTIMPNKCSTHWPGNEENTT